MVDKNFVKRLMSALIAVINLGCVDSRQKKILPRLVLHFIRLIKIYNVST